MNTLEEYNRELADCRAVFEAKLSDYGPSWRMMRPSTITDQLFIKAKRLRQIQTSGQNHVGEDEADGFTALVNYSLIGLIQIQLGYSDCKDISNERALELYDARAEAARNLMIAKNSDYGEAWRDMRIESLVDIILTKILRNKEIEDHAGLTSVSEGADANYFDIANYALFALIKLR